jgi:hypothetical protein
VLTRCHALERCPPVYHFGDSLDASMRSPLALAVSIAPWSVFGPSRTVGRLTRDWRTKANLVGFGGVIAALPAFAPLCNTSRARLQSSPQKFV